MAFYLARKAFCTFDVLLLFVLSGEPARAEIVARLDAVRNRSCVLCKMLKSTKARKHVFMKTIVLASQKGGAGKTTLAAHLAVAADLAGDGPAVLIDTDPQGSLAAWWNAREATSPALAPTTIAGLADHLKALAKAGFTYAVVDTPPAITQSIRAVLAVADLAIIPTRPSPHDLRAIGHTVELARDAGKPFFFTVTQAKAGTLITVQAIAALSAHGAVAEAIVHDRVDYAASMTDGRSVLETDPKGRSAAEMVALWSFTKARLNESTKGRNR